MARFYSVKFFNSLEERQGNDAVVSGNRRKFFSLSGVFSSSIGLGRRVKQNIVKNLVRKSPFKPGVSLALTLIKLLHVGSVAVCAGFRSRRIDEDLFPIHIFKELLTARTRG